MSHNVNKSELLISNGTHDKLWIVQSSQTVQRSNKQLCPLPATGSKQSAEQHMLDHIQLKLNGCIQEENSLRKKTIYFTANYTMEIIL